MVFVVTVVATMLRMDTLKERASIGAVDGSEALLDTRIDWDKISMLPLLEGNKLDRGVQEVLASEEWDSHNRELLELLFRSQDRFRPSLRRLLRDPDVGADVGAKARDWLDLLDDPGDQDLFVKGRRYKPKKEVKETDLVEALKATARQRHFFSSAPEPRVTIDSITFTDDLDRALVQCGINRAALTGISWEFVFRKVGKQWELRSAREAGRG